MQKKPQVCKSFKKTTIHESLLKKIAQICIPNTRAMTQNQEVKIGKVRIGKQKTGIDSR